MEPLATCGVPVHLHQRCAVDSKRSKASSSLQQLDRVMNGRQFFGSVTLTLGRAAFNLPATPCWPTVVLFLTRRARLSRVAPYALRASCLIVSLGSLDCFSPPSGSWTLASASPRGYPPQCLGDLPRMATCTLQFLLNVTRLVVCLR